MKFVEFDERKIEHSESPYAPGYQFDGFHGIDCYCFNCNNTYLDPYDGDPCPDCTCEGDSEIEIPNDRLNALNALNTFKVKRF